MNLYELYAILRLDSSQFEAGLNDSEKKAASFGQKLGSGLTKAAKVGGIALAAAGTAAAAFSVSAIKDSAAFADEINTLSKVTGMSTERLQEYTYAADLLDVSVDTISGSLSRLTKNMDSAKSGTGEAADAFAALGIDVVDANGNLRDSNAVFDEAIEALGQIENETERDAAAMAIFGRSARELNPMIKAGSKALKGLRKEAHKVGAVLDSDTLDALNNVQDGFDRLKGAWGSLKKQLGAKIGERILPDLEKLVGLFQNLAATGDFGDFVDGIGDMIDDIVKEIPKYTEKIIQAIPKVINSISKIIVKLLPDLAKTIGETLGQLLRNLPELIEAGANLVGALAEGVIMFIPNLVSGIVDGFNGPEVSAATQAMIDKCNDIKEAMAEIPTAADRVQGAFDDLETQQGTAQKWFDIFKDLRSLTDPTAEDFAKMQTAAARLNELIPNLGLKLDEETGKWNLSNSEIEKNIKLLEARSRASAYYSAADEALTEISKIELARAKLEEEIAPLQKQHEYYKGYVQYLYDVRQAIIDSYDELNRGVISVDDYLATVSELTGKEVTTLEKAAEQSRIVARDLETATGIYNELNDQLRPATEGIEAYDQRLEELNKDVDWLFDQGATWEMKAESTADSLVKGLTRGIEKGGSIVKTAAGGLMTKAIDQMKYVAQIHSPSKVTENVIGKNLALGVVKGWEDVMDGGIGRRSFTFGSAVDSMRRNSTVNNTANYGGVSVNVYARDGQSEEAIANMVMVRMQSAVDARKAVFA